MILEQLRQREVIREIVVATREMELCLTRSTTESAQTLDYNISHILISTSSSSTGAEINQARDEVTEIHQLLLSGEKSNRTVHTTGTYGCTQGPRLETSAEIERLRKDGCYLVGMTAMPEAALARKWSIPFGSICLVVNAAAGRGDGPIQNRTIQSAIAQGSPNLLDIVGRTIPGLKNGLG